MNSSDRRLQSLVLVVLGSGNTNQPHTVYWEYQIPRVKDVANCKPAGNLVNCYICYMKNMVCVT